MTTWLAILGLLAGLSGAWHLDAQVSPEQIRVEWPRAWEAPAQEPAAVCVYHANGVQKTATLRRGQCCSAILGVVDDGFDCPGCVYRCAQGQWKRK